MINTQSIESSDPKSADFLSSQRIGYPARSEEEHRKIQRDYVLDRAI